MGKVRTVWEVAGDVRRLVNDLNLARTYPELDMVCFVGINTVQLEVRSPYPRHIRLVVNLLADRLKKLYPDWTDFCTTRLEPDLGLVIISSEDIEGRL